MTSLWVILFTFRVCQGGGEWGGNAPVLYSGSTRFGTRSGHWIFEARFLVVSPFSVGECRHSILKQATIAFIQTFTCSQFISHVPFYIGYEIEPTLINRLKIHRLRSFTRFKAVPWLSTCAVTVNLCWRMLNALTLCCLCTEVYLKRSCLLHCVKKCHE
jgi:hypothetical protein